MTDRYSSLIQARCQPGFGALIDGAAKARGMSASEWLRQAARTALQLEGVNPDDIAARDAGALYDALNGQRRYALVTPAGAILSMSYHDAEPLPDPQDRGVWLPVVHEDSEPFDIATHWRMAPVTTIESGRVVVTFPVVPKSLEAM